MDMKDHDLLVQIDTKVDGINDHLTTINGTLLRHQQQIHDSDVAVGKLKTRVDERTRPGWMPQSRKGWFTGGTVMLALMTLAATFAAKLIEVLS